RGGASGLGALVQAHALSYAWREEFVVPSPEPRPIHAITFDFWRTLFYAYTNNDERRRARVYALAEVTGLEPSRTAAAIDHMSREFLRVHVEEQRTLTPADSIPIIEEFLGITIALDAAAGLVERFANALLEFPPNP